MNFDYILDKIKKAEFETFPFRHLVIDDFLSPEHFKEIINDKQIHFGKTNTQAELREILNKTGYDPIVFPGCTTDENLYFRSLEKRSWKNIHRDLPDGELEGFGVAYRLKSIQNEKIKKLISFLNSRVFKKSLEEKFGIKNDTRVTTRLHKYLTGYEISPHPDIRQKALTYLLNVNPPGFETEDIHTRLLSFKSSHEKVYKIWESETNYNRAWVPWDWCKTDKIISKNNSIVLFKPHNRSLHAVKLNYNHLNGQRTQIYGNLMYTNPKNYKSQSYKDLV